MKNDKYILSTVFGLAAMTLNKSNRGYALVIGLYPKGNECGKATQTLTVSGFKKKREAIVSWESIGSYLEIKLHELMRNLSTESN